MVVHADGLSGQVKPKKKKQKTKATKTSNKKQSS